MRAVIPAAGEGTRLRPLTADRPKGLVEVAGRPLLEHVFGALAGLPVDEAIVVVGYRGDDIVERFGERVGSLRLRYVRQDEPRGLADAVSRAEPHVDSDVLVLNGDNVLDADLTPVLEHHRRRAPAATVPVQRVPATEAAETGVAVVEDGRVRRVVEKPAEPPARTALTGAFVFSPAIFDACRAVARGHTGEYELSAAIQALIARGERVDAVPFPGWRRNVNTPADVEAVERRLGGESSTA